MDIADISKEDESLRRSIIEKVLLGIFFIGVIQSIATIFAHQSNSTTLWMIISLVPLVGLTYWYVRKTGNAEIVGRILMYASIPVLIYRAYTMGGVWGVTTNWLYLVPVFGALFLNKKEIILLAIISTILMIWLGIAHNQDPEYAMKNLLLVPAFARVIYLLMPLYVISYIIIFYENQRKSYIKQIQKKSEQDVQNEKLISIGSMSAGMAHEINNPLMVLKGSTKIIESQLKKENLEGEREKKVSKHLDHLNTAIDRIAKIVESVKSLSRNPENIEKETISLNQIFEESLLLFNDKIDGQGIKIKYDQESLNHLEVYGVKIQLEQILMNFISNSIDAIKEQNDPWIKFQFEKINDICRLRIIDSGVGIDKSIINQLFNPFFTTKEVGQGTGLGLSLCKSMASKNDGDIYYELYNGHTSFVFEIPLAN